MKREITTTQFLAFVLFALPALSVVFGFVPDKWMGMTIVMGTALAAAVFLPSVRRRLKPSLLGLTGGLGAGVLLYVITLLGVAFLAPIWPGFESSARTLYAWRVGHSPLFIAITLVMIILAEEMVWRGIVARYLIERRGMALGIVSSAAIYALAHAATWNPVLLLAALVCGIYWGCLYAMTDSIVVPVASHLLWDVLVLFLFPVVRM